MKYSYMDKFFFKHNQEESRIAHEVKMRENEKRYKEQKERER